MTKYKLHFVTLHDIIFVLLLCLCEGQTDILVRANLLIFAAHEFATRFRSPGSSWRHVCPLQIARFVVTSCVSASDRPVRRDVMCVRFRSPGSSWRHVCPLQIARFVVTSCVSASDRPVRRDVMCVRFRSPGSSWRHVCPLQIVRITPQSGPCCCSAVLCCRPCTRLRSRRTRPPTRPWSSSRRPTLTSATSVWWGTRSPTRGSRLTASQWVHPSPCRHFTSVLLLWPFVLRFVAFFIFTAQYETRN